MSASTAAVAAEDTGLLVQRLLPAMLLAESDELAGGGEQEGSEPPELDGGAGLEQPKCMPANAVSITRR